jgi:hypothetical protein
MGAVCNVNAVLSMSELTCKFLWFSKLLLRNSDYFTFSLVRLVPMEALNLLSGNGWRPSKVVDAIDAVPFQPCTQSK